MEFVGQFEGQRLHSVHVNLWTSIFLMCRNSASLIHRVRISCEIFGHGSRTHWYLPSERAQASYLSGKQSAGMKTFGEFFISCPKQRLGHKGEASHRDSTRLDLLFVPAFLLSSANEAGEDHCRWLLLSHDYARLGS